MATADRVTRVAADLMDSAAVEGQRSSRSAKQQLDYWARVGRAVTAQHTAPRRRVEAALRGELPLADLTTEEGVVFVAERNTAIAGSIATTHLGNLLASEGTTTVALDDEGRLVEHRPDGSTAILS